MALNDQELTIITNYIKKQIKAHEEKYNKLDKIFYSNYISLEKRIEIGIDKAKEGSYLTAMRECLCMIEGSIDIRKF